MAIRFAATMNAINRGLHDMAQAKAVDMIEDWESALSDIDVPGSKGIARDLGALRKQLECDAPDDERVMALLHRLGQATTTIADKADNNQAKLRDLGQALTECGDEQSDEAEDAAAAAQPKRRKAA
jgi:small-conductance mechanosensitive channel